MLLASPTLLNNNKKTAKQTLKECAWFCGSVLKIGIKLTFFILLHQINSSFTVGKLNSKSNFDVRYCQAGKFSDWLWIFVFYNQKVNLDYQKIWTHKIRDTEHFTETIKILQKNWIYWWSVSFPQRFWKCVIEKKIFFFECLHCLLSSFCTMF